MFNEQPQFNFWHETLTLELDMLTFVRSIREGDFLLYRQCLVEMLPIFFAMDHTNYGRWASVQLQDMMQLENRHPSLYESFVSGHFTVQKSMRVGSRISTDQAHEQENAKIKGDGGAVGLFHDEKVLRRWMVAGQELAALTDEFLAGSQAPKLELQHQEQNKSFQNQFKGDVEKMVTKFEEVGKPFLEDSYTLFAIDTKDVMDDTVVEGLATARSLGKEQFKTFYEQHICNESNKPITNTIHKK